jgi:Transcriptional regulator
MGKGDLRDAILDAVSRVVARVGISGTTLEAVAKEAGISKGGLLYYFGSKKDLLLGMVERYENGFHWRRAEMMEMMEPAPNRVLKASVTLMLADMDMSPADIPNAATVLDDPDLRARIGLFKKQLVKDMSKGLKRPDKAAIAMYMIDGLWMERRMSRPIIPKAGRASAVANLMELIDSAD